MIKPILTQEDEFSGLRTPTIEVAAFDDELRALVADMWDTMYACRGVGLAATQIGSNQRVAVIDTPQSENSNRRLVMVNPRIVACDGEQTGSEGCLSMPGLRWPITRAANVTVEFCDIDGLSHQMRVHALLARAVQHECDHLDGVLCNSRANQEIAND